LAVGDDEGRQVGAEFRGQLLEQRGQILVVDEESG
jgi:hypothetical protein